MWGEELQEEGHVQRLKVGLTGKSSPREGVGLGKVKRSVEGVRGRAVSQGSSL